MQNPTTAPERVTIPGVDPSARERLAAVQSADARHRAGRIFLTLRGKMKPYTGQVPAHVKAKRRAKNKVARASRRANRSAR